jgi:hypothetical protein
MKVRLVKPDLSLLVENDEKPPDETQLINTIRLWVQDFKTTKAQQFNLDFRRIHGDYPRSQAAKLEQVNKRRRRTKLQKVAGQLAVKPRRPV